MNIGGVEKSMASLLTSIPLERYEVHLGLVHLEGGLMPILSSDIKIHPITDISEHWDELKEPPLFIILNYIKNGRLIKSFFALICYLICKICGSYFWWVHFVLKDVKGLKEEYDVAIAYSAPASDIDYYLCNKIHAKKKLGWIHFDISKYGIDKKATKRLYQQYDRIFIVSETGKMIFDNVFPQFKDKTDVFHNIVSPSRIIEMAKVGETFNDGYTGKRILTVGRISPEKGQRVAIQAFQYIIKKYPNLRWYFIGDGIDKENCMAITERLNLTDRIIYLGTKNNPYAYMRDCDIYLQPSLHEGFCITLAEALCFDNPIVATNFTGAKEQLRGRDNGFVVGMAEEDIATGIERALAASKTDSVRDREDTDIQKLLTIVDSVS